MRKLKKAAGMLLALAILAGAVSGGFCAAAGQEPDNLIYLAFTSDVHNNNSTDAKKNSSVVMKNWLENVTKQLGQPFEQMGFCGDYGNVPTDESTYWNYAATVFNTVKNTQTVKGSGFFVAGNHENEQGRLASTKNTAAKNIKKPGEKEVTDNYVIYSFGAESADMNKGFTTTAVNGLKSYLASAPTDRPIFILSHFPIHSLKYIDNGRQKIRTAPNAGDVVKILNDASKTHDIIFIWGHNHSQNDPMYDKIITRDDAGAELVIDVQKGTKAEIDFTYVPAGAMSTYDTFAWGGNIKARGVVAAIDKNTGNITLTYYDSSYAPFGERKILSAVGSITAQLSNGKLTAAFRPQTDIAVEFVAAFYDNDGRLVKIKTVRREAVSDGCEYEFTVDFAYSSWLVTALDGNGWRPLCAAVGG